MALFGKQTPRGKEIRRTRAERRSDWWSRQISERVQPRPLLLLVSCAIATAIVVNTGDDPLGLRVGQRLPRAMTSRVHFDILDEARTQTVRMRARDTADDYYQLDVSLLQEIHGRFANALVLARQQAAEPAKVREAAAEIDVVLDDAGLAEIIRMAGETESSAYESAVERALSVLRNQPLIEPAEQTSRRMGTEAMLLDPEQSTERQVSINRLLFANSADDATRVAESAAAEFPAALRPSVTASILAMLRGESDGVFKPLYRYDTTASAKAAEAAEQAVEPVYFTYAVGDLLAPASSPVGEGKGELTADQLALLKHEHELYLDARDSDPTLRSMHNRATLARALLAFLLVVGIGGYIMGWHARASRGVMPPATAVLTLLLLLLIARSTYLLLPWPYAAVGVHAFAVALLTITSRRTAAQAAGVLLALTITLATRQGIGYLIVLSAVSIVLSVGLRNVRNRGRIIGVGTFAAAIALAVTVMVGLVEGQSALFTLTGHAASAAIATVVAAFIVEGVLPYIERIFGVTTDMTLLEWCDPNKQVLRILAAESPGTYNHSLQVGALANAAADAIGANGLLARAGAYYHDIGKINKPEYFVENQGMGVDNRHERLSPAMSHLIIIGHVKDGIEMAKAYGVPTRLHAFIPEHHGTTIVEYFYHAASQARKPGDPEISDTQFRYPGPKPQTRETAIVMMCDAVEGAVRAMAEPTPNRIEDVVSRMLEKRLVDGQFDECDLTFRELALIRDSLVKTLISIYHGRIKYPSDEQARDSEKPAEPSAESDAGEKEQNVAEPRPAS